VEVSGALPTTFLNLLGFTRTTIRKQDIAMYLPPLLLGQPGSRLGPAGIGDLGDPSKSAPYFIRTEGWATNRGEGDAYTPDATKQNLSCTTAPTTRTTAADGDSTDVHRISGATEVSDATMTGAGGRTLPTRGGYNFLVTVPTGGSERLQIFNPAFAADLGYVPPSVPLPRYSMHEQDTLPTINAGANESATPADYSVMQYTVFQVTDQFDHRKDIPITQVWFNPLNADNAPSGPYKDMRTGLSAGTAPQVYHALADIVGPALPSVPESGGLNGVGSAVGAPGALGPGTYRVRVDTLDYQGGRPGDGGNICSLAHKGFGIQTVNLDGTPCAACSVSGMNELAIFTPLSAGQFTIPVFYVPADYAGLTIDFSIFDPGDTSGSASISLVGPPPNNTVVTASPAFDVKASGVSRDATGTAVNSCVTGSQASATTATVKTNYPSPGTTSTCSAYTTNVWNSQWLHFRFQVPTNYVAGYYSLQYQTGGTASDTVTMAVAANSVAVHLLP
jgi:hypothetical protein